MEAKFSAGAKQLIFPRVISSQGGIILRILSLILGAILGLATIAAAQTYKLGYVQVDLLMQNFPEHEDASKTYDKELESWQTQLNEYQQEIQSLEEEFQQRAMLFSPEKKREKQDEKTSYME